MSNPNTQTFGAEHFDKVASSYEPARSQNPMVKIAQDLISLAPPITRTSIIHDNAAGPGIITGEILQHLQTNNIDPPTKIYASDISPAMIDQLHKKNWMNVEAEVMDSQALAYADETFTHSFMNMGIFLLPEPEKGASEIYRTLKPGGVAIITSIRSVGWIRIFQTAQREVKSDAPLWKGPMAEEWSTKEKLKSVVVAGGFKEEDVVMERSDATMGSDGIGGFMSDLMVEKMTTLVTGGWEVDEIERFKKVLGREIQRAMDEPYVLEVGSWVAVARK